MRASDLELGSQPAAEAAPALARGTALGRFIVLGLVGRGAMGEVYGAYDPELDRKIAIKLLRTRAGDSTDNRARLAREAKATAKVAHPNVVVVYDTGTFGARVFIAMEFIEGHTLRYWLQARERTWDEILDAFIAAGRGLAAAHDKELVHRDFKPDNVMVTSPGDQVRVMDFGLARFVATVEPEDFSIDLDGTIELSSGRPPTAPLPESPTTESQHKLTATGAILGTPAYMSPEQFSSQPADARSDQFSFCVALHEALFGERPFAGRSLQELADNVTRGQLAEPPTSRRVPSWIKDVLRRGLRAAPAERFPTMNALLEELARGSGAGRTSFARNAAAKLAGIWEAPVASRAVDTAEKRTMREAFLATGKPYAATVFATASGVLDRYAQRWTELYVEVCEATHVRGEQSAEVLDLRIAALNEGLADLKALCRLFREATGQVVENAVRAAQALGTLERCSDVRLLRATVRPPEDTATRAAVDELRQRLVEVRAFYRVGRIAASRAAIDSLEADARRVGYAPVLAEILFLSGHLQVEFARGTTQVSTLEEAFSVAELARHDEVAAAAATILVFDTGYIQGRFDAAEVWNRCAEALLGRMGGHELERGWLYGSRANVREQQGRIPEAIADARQAIASTERALGPRTYDTAICRNNLANHLAFGGHFDEALEESGRAVEIASEVVSPDHPTMAFCLATRAQILYRLGRYDEARPGALQALSIIERELDPRGTWVTQPLRTLGLCHLAQNRPREAVVALERALAIREAGSASPLRLAELRAPLARSLYLLRGQRTRALALARQALEEYQRTARAPIVARDLADLERWLARHDATSRPKRRAAPAKPARAAKSPKTRARRSRG